jgi:hypothetical protein
VVLPYLSGFELARWTRSVHPETNVLYMSGYPQTKFIDRSWADIYPKAVYRGEIRLSCSRCARAGVSLGCSDWRRNMLS